MPISVAVERVGSGDLPLATWLSTAPSAPSKIRTGETYSEGLWSGWANGSTVGSGATYTKKDNAATPAALTLHAAFTITITAPTNTLKEDGTAGGSVYAYVDSSTGVKYTHDDLVNALKDGYVDVKVERQSGSRAKFYALGTSDISAPTAAGADGLNSQTSDTIGYSSTGYSLSGIGSGTVLKLGLYVEGEGFVDQTGESAPHGNFTVKVVKHGGSFTA